MGRCCLQIGAPHVLRAVTNNYFHLLVDASIVAVVAAERSLLRRTRRGHLLNCDILLRVDEEIYESNGRWGIQVDVAETLHDPYVLLVCNSLW